MPKSTYLNLPEDKKEDIYYKALELFVANDYENIGVRDIAQACGFAVGSFYKYFETKDEMYLYYFTHTEKRIVELEAKGNFTKLQFWPSPKLEDCMSDLEISFNRTWYRMPNHIYSAYYFDGYAFEVYTPLKNLLDQYDQEGKLKDNLNADIAYYLLVTSMYNFLLYCRKQGWTDHETEIVPVKEYFFNEMLLPSILRPDAEQA